MLWEVPQLHLPLGIVAFPDLGSITKIQSQLANNSRQTREQTIKTYLGARWGVRDICSMIIFLALVVPVVNPSLQSKFIRMRSSSEADS